MQSSQEIRMATAIFPTLSLLNHSCCPNTSLAFTTGVSASAFGPDLSKYFTENANRGVTAAVRAAKAVTPGQEILHCYGKKCPWSTKQTCMLMYCICTPNNYYSSYDDGFSFGCPPALLHFPDLSSPV